MKPLQGITILDLSRVLACPFASMILAEMGATVIKVEQPGEGDETRSFEPFVQTAEGSESAYFMAFNRSKRSITVNLRSPEGQAIIRDLAAKADVILVLGAKNSSNSNRLREIGDDQNVPSYLIDDAEGLKPEWLVGKNVVGITAGASAPEALVDELIAKLRTLAEIQVEMLDGVTENIHFKLPHQLRSVAAAAQ
jgi:hypothetical protein